MLEEHSRDTILRCLWPADFLAFDFCVGHARFHAGADHGEFELAEYSCHLQKCLAHGISLTVTAVDGDAADNLQAEMLFSDDVDDFAELLRGSGQTAYF